MVGDIQHQARFVVRQLIADIAHELNNTTVTRPFITMGQRGLAGGQAQHQAWRGEAAGGVQNCFQVPSRRRSAIARWQLANTLMNRCTPCLPMNIGFAAFGLAFS